LLQTTTAEQRQKLLLNIWKEILNSDVSLSYSQQSEDIVLIKIFNKKWGGCFVDIGAFHPKKYSNTHLLTKLGWTGINIEPNPDQFIFFEKKRKKDINLNIGISLNDDELNYYAFNNPAVNTFDKLHAEKWSKESGFKIIKECKIKVQPLSIVLSKHLTSGRQIYLMTIDVEGLDIDVLKSNDWEKYRPSVILIESDIYSNLNILENPIFCFLNNQNYSLYWISGVSLFFKDNFHKF
jgi:FkbM family methyltransferase